MIYGRRVIESHEWLYKKPRHIVKIIDSGFQWKYTLYLTSALFGSALIFFIPAWYFLNDNYQIFYRLAEGLQPRLLSQMEREVSWLFFFLAVSLVAILGLCVFLGLKLTESILGPLISLERHMRKTTHGDFSQRDFTIRSEDDFRTLANTYSYLYKSVKAQAEQDLKWLEKISVDPKNKEAYSAWRSLLDLKREQLGLAPIDKIANDPVVDSDAAPEKRRVS